MKLFAPRLESLWHRRQTAGHNLQIKTVGSMAGAIFPETMERLQQQPLRCATNEDHIHIRSRCPKSSPPKNRITEAFPIT